MSEDSLSSRRSFKLPWLLAYALICLNMLSADYSHAGAYEDFFRAIKEDQVDTVRSLMRRGMQAEMLDPALTPAFFVAAQQRAWETLKLFLGDEKIDWNYRSPAGETVLMLAALHGEYNLCQALLKRGAKLNQPGWTALHYAATSGQDNIIRLLLDADAYIDAESPNQTTPLMMAARSGNRATVRLLIDLGADPSVVNQQGYSAARFAHEFGDMELAAWLGRQDDNFRVKHGLPLRPEAP
ncbi:ankyrin repeat domain-containing protein [Parvibium lacunae]|nr:ankyrin repeat domain-containing protein [Parvibium lacunae]